MKKILVLVCITLCAVVLLVFCSGPVAEEHLAGVSTEAISPDSMVKRGAYMVSIMGCNDCHSPKLMGPQGPYPDPDRLLSGHPGDMPVGKFDTGTAKNWILFNPMLTAVVGPWGTSFSANITSDSTGI